MPIARPVHTVVDVSAVAALFADPTRARILSGLSDGRALPASMLAAESGVSPSTASEHLSRLVAGGLVTVTPSGRHRYYRLADERVGAVLEALAVLAPETPIRSLRESGRAAALRRSRTCYDHLAGQLGVAVTEALVRRRALVRADGRHGVDRAPDDPLAAPMPVHPYQLGPKAATVFGELGVPIPAGGARSGRRPLLRFCVDWTEQRHHLAGALGAAVLTRMEQAEWVRRLPSYRALEITPAGQAALAEVLGV
jgi:DNA-binding transcriptional ArsR family regulator